MEKEQQDGINEETKHLEKLANKRSLLLNKVGVVILSDWENSFGILQYSYNIFVCFVERGQHEENQGAWVAAD